VDRYVDSPAALADAAAALRREPRLAVDTEAASFHRYRDRIYLIQLAAPGHSIIVDPLAVPDLSAIGALLADPQIEKVFHDADYDLRVLDRDYGFHARRVFDTRIAAQLTGEPAIGLAALLEKHLGVTLSKTHQKGDWSRRPLPPAMLAYAADDTRHLLELRDRLDAQLNALGRSAWAGEEFLQLENLRWTGGADGEEPYLRIKGAKRLSPVALAALRELVQWRDALAARDDKAVFRVIGNVELLAVAKALPRNADALTAISELPAALARRHGPALLEAVARALAVPESQLPRLPRVARLPKDPGFDERVERLKEARNKVAVTLGLDPGVLCGRPILEAIARMAPLPTARAALARVSGLRRWQLDTIGDALLGVLA
jgi:ribonuclease D